MNHRSLLFLLMAFAFAPTLAGCVVEERYPRPVYYERVRVVRPIRRPVRGVVIVGENAPTGEPLPRPA